MLLGISPIEEESRYIYYMHLQYNHIREHIANVDHAEFKDKLLTEDGNQEVEDLLRRLSSQD